MHWASLIPLLLLPFPTPDPSGRVSPQRHLKEGWFHQAAGEVAFAAGRLDDAEKEFAAAAGRGQRAAAMRLAEVWLAQGKYPRAEQQARTTWARVAREHGAESPEAARCLDVEARACGALGIDDEAARLAHLAWDIRAKKLPADHFDIAESVHTRRALWRRYDALPLIATGLFARDGGPDAERSLAVQQKALPPGDPRLAPCLLAAARAVTWDDTDELPVAEKRLLAAIELVTKHHGDANPALADYWTELARISGAQRKVAHAEATQRKAVELLRKVYGPRHPRLARPLAVMSMIRASLGRLAEAESLAVEASRCHFSALTDVELCAAFDRVVSTTRRTEYLLEMARRKGPTIANHLAGKHAELLEARRTLDSFAAWRQYPNLELLTALRRARNRPDPLPVVLRVGEGEESIFPHLPAVEASLVNRDFQKKPILYQDGGDYRGGRQERWRFDVRDAKGNIVPVKPREDPDGGGLFQCLTLKAGESWDTVLDMRRFIDLTPGEYTVTVEYHDRQEIASYLHTGCLFVCRSEPFKLHVQPRVIGVSKADREAVRAAVAGLGPKDGVRVLAGTYSKADHEFIAPASPAGRVFSLGWKAVPQLLEELDDPKLTAHQRAWVLAFLFGITSWNDPRDEPDAIGRYESRGRGWAVPGGRNGKVIVNGAGWGGGKLVAVSDTINETKQKAFAGRWKAFRDYIIVRE